jgi:PBSX family phage portal protein
MVDWTVGASMPEPENGEIEAQAIEFAKKDPFGKSWEDVKKFSGLDNNFKRRTQRNIAKFFASDEYMDSAKANSTGQGDARSKEINPGTVFRNGYGLFDVITPPWNLYQLASFYDTSFANHAAIDAKVANIVGLGYYFDISKRAEIAMSNTANETALEKARKRLERGKMELEAWIDDLNSDDSFSETLEKVFVDLQSTGNGYLEIGRTVDGDIGYVGHIPATTVRVRRLRDGFVQIIGNRVVYFRNFGAKNSNPITDDPRPNEIIHIKEYSPLNTFYGVPDIMPAISSLQGDQLASQYNIDYFANKGVPRYIITLKGAKLSSDAEDKLFRFLQTNLRNQSHRTLYIPLPPDTDGNKVEFKMDAVENGVQESSFKEYRKENRDDILIAHQVPLTKIGGGDASNLAAALSQDRTFKEQVSRPAQRNLEKVINKIIHEKTDMLDFRFNELTLTDENVESQIVERYVKTQVMTINEAREKLGLPPRADGDRAFEMNSRQAADMRANTAQNRERDSQRSSEQSDGDATVSGRNPQGEGNRSE